MSCIAYKNGYKYQLCKEFSMDIPIKPSEDIDIEYVKLTRQGRLTVKKGYAWDGPSGPTFDTRTFMRGSLVHDALYQLMRDGYLDKEFRAPADRLLKSMCKKDGMYWIRAWWVHLGVHFGAGFAVDPASRKPLILAPKSCK